ncbi:hypothetical protein KAF25_005867 [Fusarium avenaceum]|uniref:WD40 repeat-like protein n=1 Tax=Fusarium avenaceum TaxID=40199 RepID=A0A9P7GZM8_9HYPO|nr:hypothetical protein KAF25_005867 [Fusarium avenaceum]
MEDKRGDTFTHRLRGFRKKVKSKIGIRPRNSATISSDRPSRVSTFADRTTDDAPSPVLEAEHGTSNALRPSPSIDTIGCPEPASENNTFPAKNNVSLWSQAYIEAKEDPEFVKLLESYKKFLIQRYGFSQSGTPEAKKEDSPIQKLAKRALDDLESSHLTFRIGEEKIVVREQVKNILDFLTTFKSVIGAAAAAEPSASLAWTGVMAALPFLENILTQDESAVDGFERISFLLIRYTLLEKELFDKKSCHLTSRSVEHVRVVQGIKERIIKVYVIVYQYQIRIILQYAHGKPRRMLGDMFLHNDWKTMVKDINEKDNEIDRAANGVKHSWLKDQLDSVDYSIKELRSNLHDFRRELLSKFNLSMLDRIPYVENAVFDSQQVDRQGMCLVGTQCNALSTIQSWAESPDSDPIFWLVGKAGTGKSSIARTVANCLDQRQQFYSRESQLDDRTILGATFFMSQEDPSRNTVKLVFPTLARTLARNLPDLGEQISQNFYRDTTVGHKKLVEQMRRLISEPMAVVSKALMLSVRLIIIIDSLDECQDSSEAEELLRLLPILCKYHPLDVRILVISRPVRHISNILGDPNFGAKEHTLEKIPRHTDDAEPDDITKFLKSELKDIIKSRDNERGWVTDEDIRQLVDRADGLFIYAATTCRFLNAADDDEDIQISRLKKLIEAKADKDSPEACLDDIYRKVLSFPARNLSQEEKTTVYTKYRCILGLIALAFEPPLITTLEILTRKKGLGKTLVNFRSILEVHTDDLIPLTFYHLSFRDFLLDKERSGADFTIDEAAVHRDLFLNCLSIMNNNLVEDICDLKHPGTLASDVSKDRVDKHIPQHLKYACFYFSRHLMKFSTFKSAASYLEDASDIYHFLSTKLLGWLEALSLLKEYSRSISIIKDLQSLVTPEASPKLSLFIQDAYRFALKNYATISQAPLQTYCSALIFSPSKSLVRAKFLHLIPVWITKYPEFREQWDPELMTLPGSNYNPAISGDGKTLVTRDPHGVTKIWDLSTGAEMAKFSCSSADNVQAISRNGGTVACALMNGKILLRSLTDEDESILVSDNKVIDSISFSPTEDLLAAFSSDYRLLIWDVKTSELIKSVTMGHGKEVYRCPLVFSPCGQTVLAGGGSAVTGGIFVWDMRAQTQKTVMRHEGETRAIAISPDGQRVASSDSLGGLIVWSYATAETLSRTKLEHFAFFLAWHPTQPPILAVARAGMSVSLCNTATPSVQIIKDIDIYGTKTIPTSGLAFSSSLEIMVTGDRKGCVRIWDTDMASTTLPRREAIQDFHHLENKRKILIVSEYTSEILDLDTGSRKKFHGYTKKAVRSPSRDLFAICSTNDTIHFFDANLSKVVRNYSEGSDIFFPEGSNVVVLMSSDKVLVLDGKTLRPQLTIELPGQWNSKVEPVFKGQHMGLVVRICDKESHSILVYQLATGKGMPSYQYPIFLDDLHSSEENVMFISPDCETIIYGTRREDGKHCYLMACFTKDISKEILPLEKDKFSTSPVFSPMGDYVVIGTSSGNISVWDTKTMSQVKNLVTGTFPVVQLHFCTGERMGVKILVDGRLDIQLWDMERFELLEVDEGVTDIGRSINHSTRDLHFDSKQGWLSLSSYDKNSHCRFITERDNALLYVQAGWIWQGNHRILLLPSEFRQSFMWLEFPFTTVQRIHYPIVAACGGSIVLGLESGDVTAFEFVRSKMGFERKPGNISGA